MRALGIFIFSQDIIATFFGNMLKIKKYRR